MYSYLWRRWEIKLPSVWSSLLKVKSLVLGTPVNHNLCQRNRTPKMKDKEGDRELALTGLVLPLNLLLVVFQQEQLVSVRRQFSTGPKRPLIMVAAQMAPHALPRQPRSPGSTTRRRGHALEIVGERRHCRGKQARSKMKRN